MATAMTRLQAVHCFCMRLAENLTKTHANDDDDDDDDDDMTMML